MPVADSHWSRFVKLGKKLALDLPLLLDRGVMRKQVGVIYQRAKAGGYGNPLQIVCVQQGKAS